MTPLRWLIGLWHQTQHRIDVETFWPELKRQAGSREYALAVYRTHMEIDPSYGHMSEAEKQAFLSRLP